MTFPTLPTDNLYKFLAIAGVVAVLASNYMTSNAMISMQELRSNEVKEFNRENEGYYERLVDGVRKDHEEKAERSRELNSLEGVVAKRSAIRLKTLKDRVDQIDAEAGVLIWMLGIVEKIGFAITPIGFFFWWLKVQRHQDMLLRIEREKALKEHPLEPSKWWLYLCSWFQRSKPKNGK